MRKKFTFLGAILMSAIMLILEPAAPVTASSAQSTPMPTPGTTSGQYTVKVVQVDTSHFPQIGVWVSVLDAQGNPVTSVPDSGFTLTENGQPVKITDVSRAGEGQAASVNSVLAIDRSGSMARSNKLNEAKTSADAFVDQMRPTDSAGVVTFDVQAQTLQGLTSDKAALHKAIDSIQVGGNTAIYDALSTAVGLLSNAQGRKAIILLTDGLDNSSKSTLKDVTTKAQTTELSVYTIGLGDPSLGNSEAGINEAALKSIADQTNGTYTYAPDPKNLSALYAQLSHQLQSEYHLTYVSANTLHNGVGRNIQVQVAGAGNVQASYNPGGVIPETAPAATWPLFIILLLVLLFLLVLPTLLRNAGARRATTGPAGSPSSGRPRVKLTGASQSATGQPGSGQTPPGRVPPANRKRIKFG